MEWQNFYQLSKLLDEMFTLGQTLNPGLPLPSSLEGTIDTML